MKRNSIILIVGLCVAAVAFGIVGLIMSNRNKSTSVSEDDRDSEMSIYDSRKGMPFAGLDDVVMSVSVPSVLVSYNGFRLSFNPENHTPNWVAWELLGTETEGNELRSDKFWKDTGVEGCADPRDYVRSGYDRGHIVPAADQKWSTESMEDCFAMTNICPQEHALNSGAWNTLENKSRLWARRDSALVIVAGPIFESGDRKRIGATGVRVPSAFFKVILAPYVDEPRAIGFVYPNMSAPGNMQLYSMTVDEVERITGYDFFHNLPDSIENRVESVTSFKEWNSVK